MSKGERRPEGGGAVPDAPVSARLLAKLTGARLCFGRPVEAQGRTVIPVARVRSAGRLGALRGRGAAVDGAEPVAESGLRGLPLGSRGAVEARPVGYIEITPEWTRFERISSGTTLGAGAWFALLGLVAGGTALARTPQARTLAGRAVAGLPLPAALPGPLARLALQARARLARGQRAIQRS